MLASTTLLTGRIPAARRRIWTWSGEGPILTPETLARLLGLEAAESRRALTLDPAVLVLLREADQAVASTLGRWKYAYGIV